MPSGRPLPAILPRMLSLPPSEIGCLSMMEWLITNSLLTAATVGCVCFVGYKQSFHYAGISLMKIVPEVDDDLKYCVVLLRIPNYSK